MNSPKLDLSIVIPIYMNAESIHEVVDRLCELSTEMDVKLEAVFVIDGSPDASYEVLRKLLPSKQFTSQIIQLSRNFGSFAAIRVGLEAARAPIMTVMAADLQEPKHLIPDLFKLIIGGEHDIAVATRAARDDPNSSKLFSKLFWAVYRICVQPTMPPGGIDVFACNRNSRDGLLSLNELNSSLVGQLIWIGYRVATVPYSRQAREHGKSQWTFRKKWRYMVDSIFSFTDVPIMLITALGVFGAIAIVGASLTVMIARMMGQIQVLGYTPLMLTILGCTFLLQTSIGIVGNYVWRTFENSKRRPLSLVLSHELLDPREE